MKSKKTICILALAVLLIGAAIVILLCTGGNKTLNLPYVWGTAIEEIRANETVLVDGTDSLKCAADYAHPDQISELTIENSEVSFRFDQGTEGLSSIWYRLGNTASNKAQVELLKSYYGDQCYTENGMYFWWVDDTVIMYYSGELMYRHESFISNNSELEQSLRAFFGK